MTDSTNQSQTVKIRFNPSLLKKAREQAGLTQKGAAIVAQWTTPSMEKVTGQYIWNWEHGVCMPRVNTLSVLAHIYGVTLDYFME